MKKALFIMLLLSSCGPSVSDRQRNDKSIKNTYEYAVYIEEIDSCQYVIAKYSHGISITHHNNCKFCKARK